LPDWHKDNLREAWSAFLASCMALKARSEWQPVCWAAAEVASHDEATLREFFEGRFRPWSVRGGDGAAEGLVTGYYEPLLRGSRGRSDRYRFALYSAPDDLVAVELGALVPELNAQRVRGRLDGRRIVPYYTRAEIDGAQAPLRGRELFWVDDQVELFFLHIQGSGRIRLDSGETVKIGYADHNGHPYRSVGKILIDRGELAPEKASMQAIQAWARRNPEKLSKVLAENPAYVFFRELPDGASGPIGSLGVALTPERSIAVDPQYVPLGAPVYLSTARPNTGESMNRLVLAQDTGSAIKGAVRADFFWGFGPEAGQLAGRTRHPGRMWVLLPRDFPPPAQRNQAGGKTTAPESDAKESEGLR
jgi:membrane-bound lytic murein transglycosylase A